MAIPTPGYTDADAARFVAASGERPRRTPFERDRARVLHSAAFRRLATKTQVVGPGAGDVVRNRLTHSLEVAQVARELGKALGCDPDVVETAALAHDLGHPPYGHNGEKALDAACQSIGGFEGNAQTLRILTRLEPKTVAPDGRSVGLNLTRAVLDASSKYPWPRSQAPSSGKFGVYDDDLAMFGWIREGSPEPARPCLEAQVMDLADDIAYSVHDVEDAVVAGEVDLFGLTRAPDRGVFYAVRDWYLPGASDDRLAEALTRLLSMPEWPSRPYDAGLATQVEMKALTSALIGRFSSAVRAATHEAFGPRPFTRYAAQLTVPDDTTTEIAVLKGVAAHFVMRRDDRVRLLREQREQLTGLVRVLLERPDRLEPLFRESFDAAADDADADADAADADAARRRAVVDQVASLTDASARSWAAELL